MSKVTVKPASRTFVVEMSEREAVAVALLLGETREDNTEWSDLYHALEEGLHPLDLDVESDLDEIEAIDITSVVDQVMDAE